MSIQAFTLVQGDNFRPSFRIGTRTTSRQGVRSIIPTDITGATVRLQARTTADASSAAIDASTTNDLIEITGPEGLIEVNVPGASTASLLGDYVWDLEITYEDGTINTPVSGTLRVTRGVTRGA